MKRLMTICAAVGVIITVTGTAHGFVPVGLDLKGIYMTSCKEHLDGDPAIDPWSFEMWIDFIDEDGLDHIDVTLPGNTTPSITIYKDGGWEYESLIDYPSLAALRVDYPAGDYAFDFLDDIGSPLADTVTLSYADLNEPAAAVDFIYPEYDGQTGIDINPALSWTIDPNAGYALGRWLWDVDANEDIYGDFPVSMDTNSWGPLGPLELNHEYGLEVSVFVIDDLLPGPTLPTATIGGSDDEFEYGLMTEYCNQIKFFTIPEPATIALLGLGALSLLRRRKT